MEISHIANTQVTVSQSVLKSAIRQPELATDLINRSLESGNKEVQRAQEPVRPVESTDAGSGKGHTIDIRV